MDLSISSNRMNPGQAFFSSDSAEADNGRHDSIMEHKLYDAFMLAVTDG